MFKNESTYKMMYRELLNTTKFKKIRSLGIESYGVAMYLFQISNHIGLFHFSKYSLIEEFGLSKYKVNLIFKDLEEIDFIKYDKENGIIFVVDMLKYTNTKLSANRNAQVKALRRQLAEVEDKLEIKKDFYNNYKDEENYKILFTRYLEKEAIKEENKVERVKKEEEAKSFVYLYNNIVETKNKTTARAGKNIVNKIQKLIDEHSITMEEFSRYCLSEDFIEHYNTISEIIDIIEKDLFMKKVDNATSKEAPIPFIEDNPKTPETPVFEDKKSKKEDTVEINVDNIFAKWGIS